jgi:Protein of unknown function (DUF2794)
MTWEENALADLTAPNQTSRTLSLVHASEHTPPRSSPGKPPALVSFNRRELMAVLGLYGRKIAAGEWRDYALDFTRDRALFSVYRRTSEHPLYVIEKNPRLARKQGQYLVTNAQGRILKRGHKLEQVLKVLEPGLVVVK